MILKKTNNAKPQPHEKPSWKHALHAQATDDSYICLRVR